MGIELLHVMRWCHQWMRPSLLTSDLNSQSLPETRFLVCSDCCCCLPSDLSVDAGNDESSDGSDRLLPDADESNDGSHDDDDDDDGGEKKEAEGLGAGNVMRWKFVMG